MDNVGDSDNSGIIGSNSSSGSSNANQNNARVLLYDDVANTVWFASNEYRLDFPEDKDKKIVSYVKVTDVSNNPEDIIKGRKAPYIRYDEDNVMVWNGKRCEATPFEDDDPEYLRLVEMLKEFE